MTKKGTFWKLTSSMFQSSSKLSNQLKRKVNRSGSSFSNSFQVGGRYGSPMWVHYATEERAEGGRTDNQIPSRPNSSSGEIIVGGNFRTETMIMSSSIFQTTDMAAKFWSINDGGTVN